MKRASPLRLSVRDLRGGDLVEVARIDGLHAGDPKPEYWRDLFPRFLDEGARERRLGLIIEAQGRPIGYLLGEVRAFEFGSGPCGWILSVAVDPGEARAGIASFLLAEACARFRRMGVTSVRTLVRRNDVPMLSFFRANEFVGGSSVELERSLEVEP